mmetsp:Transcript_4602/g.5997  ORF Transcript_4602/g.5997 Transcript_4602/m.5997 type:complete len:140 (+) Transcript_4602:231-650(+)
MFLHHPLSPGVYYGNIVDNNDSNNESNINISSKTSNTSSDNQYYNNAHDRGILKWQTGGGPIECNSNDGKRSEWVNFLRKGDHVQLLPFSIEDTMMSFVQRFDLDDTSSSRIYGISSKGRPLGSEPLVVCQWRVVRNNL